MKKPYFVALIFASFVMISGYSHAVNITAASCSQTDVQSAVNAASDGATVFVPAGICAWTQTVIVDAQASPRSLIIRGAGIDQTTILDEVPRVGLQGPVFSITTPLGKSFRLTGFTFKNSPNMTVASYGGAVQIDGDSKAFRVDHNKFVLGNFGIGPRAITTYGYLFGVIDHNTFNLESNVIALTVHHNKWGSRACDGTISNNQGCGDGSWNDTLALGTERAVYFEDNVLIRNGQAGAATDGFEGARFVARYNQMQNFWIDNHGTESSGRFRGTFSWEVYNNTFTSNGASYFSAMDVRSGTGVFFNNALAGDFPQQVVNLNTYRIFQNYGPWGTCDGSSPYDKNDGIIYDSGTHSGASVANGVLTASKNWAANQWVGYSVRNTAKNWGGQISGNTANAITVSPTPNGAAQNWDTGDTFQILRVDACLDQAGRSTGDLLSGFEPPYGPGVVPMVWPNQALEPVYAWGNTLNGVSDNVIASGAYVIKKNREYYEGVARPGYAPYTYPHPLTLTGFTADGTVPLDTSPPVISAVSSSAMQNAAAVTWSTDDPSDSQIDYGTTISYGSLTSLDTNLVVSHSQQLSGLSPSTLYHYRVKSKNMAGNLTASGDFTFTTTAPDTTQPTVSITSPTGGTVSGTMTISANAADNTGVVGVQFKLDGNNIGTEDITSPYSISWDSRGIANGTHSITVVARDAAGNSETSAIVSINVQNAAVLIGLIAAYGFDEGSYTSTVDASGNNNSGVLNNGPAWTAGRYGNALSFDSVNDYVTGSNINLPDAFTMMFWVKNPSNPPSGTIMSTNGNQKVFYLASGLMRFFDGSSDIAFGPVGPGWNHIAFVYDGANMRAYVNGTQVGTAQPLSIPPATGTFYVGAWNGVLVFNGTIDEMRIYGRALSQSEIQNDMTTPITGTGYSGIILRGRVTRTAGVACPACVVNFTMSGVNGIATTAIDGTFMTVLVTTFAPGTYNADIIITDGVTIKSFKKRITIY